MRFLWERHYLTGCTIIFIICFLGNAIPAQGQKELPTNSVSTPAGKLPAKPQNSEAKAHYDRSADFVKTKHFEQALAEFLKANQIDNGANYKIPCIYCIWDALGDPKTPFDSLSQLQKEFKDPYSQFGFRFIATLRKQNYAQALKMFDQAAAHHLLKTKGSFYYHRACLNREMNNWDKALKDIDKAIELGPPESNRYYIQAECLAGKGDYQAAIDAATKAIELMPEYASTYDLRAYYYMELHDDEKALPDLNKAIELDGKFAQPLYRRALIWQRKGEPDKSLAELNQAILLNPNRDYYWARIEIYRDMGFWDPMLQDYSTLLESMPRNAYLYKYRAECYFAKGDFSNCLRDVGRAMREGYYYPDDYVQYIKDLAKSGGSGTIKHNEKDEIVTEEWKDGKLQGVSQGNIGDRLSWECPYRDNKRNGVFRLYSKTGKLFYEVPYMDDKMKGTAKQFDESGRVIEEWDYDKGEGLKAYRQYDSQGQVVGEYLFNKSTLIDKSGKPRTATIVYHYPDTGKVSTELPYVNGKPDYSKAKYFDEKGQRQVFICPLTKMKGKERKATIVNNQAFEYYLNGENLDKALTMIDEALAISPNEFHCLSTKAELLYKLGRPKEALPFIQKALKIQPKNPELLFDLRLINDALREVKSSQTPTKNTGGAPPK